MDNHSRIELKTANNELIHIPHDVFINDVVFNGSVAVVRCSSDYKLTAEDFKRTRIFEK